MREDICYIYMSKNSYSEFNRTTDKYIKTQYNKNGQKTKRSTLKKGISKWPTSIWKSNRSH